MAPVNDSVLVQNESASQLSVPTRAHLTLDGVILEAWGEGFNVGALIMLILLVFCNYRSGTILHKLIALELFLALWHGTFIFFKDPVYGWYLSSTVILLFTSYQMHNVVSWMKIKPFLPKWGGKVYICTLIAVQPYWVAELYFNFEYFNDLGNQHNSRIRSWEALARDPWWIFTTCRLIYVIKRGYRFKLIELIRISPRFGILILCMVLSICFLLVDVIVTVAKLSRDSGINPYWRMALVFKCASDTIFLDDFKKVLDNIVNKSLGKAGGAAHRGPSGGQVFSEPQNAGSPPPKTANLDFGPVVTIHSDKPRLDTLSNWKAKLFTSRDEGIAGQDMSIQRETTITLSDLKAKRNSEGSSGSGNRILPMPEVASHTQKSHK